MYTGKEQSTKIDDTVSSRHLKEAYWRGMNEMILIVLEKIYVQEKNRDSIRNELNKLHSETAQNWKNFL